MYAQRRKILQEIGAKRGSEVVCYLTSDRQNATAQVAKDALPLFANHLQELKKKGKAKKLDVFLFTTGGDTLAAFGLARLLREAYEWVGALIPDKCQSAGTLLALGANEIVMCEAGTLSPIDPALITPLNPTAEGPLPGQRQLVQVSVESVAGFKDLAEEWGIKEAEQTVEVFKLLADRVHPLALGDVFRSRKQIERLATTLLEEHRPGDSGIGEIVRTLTRELGSHDYPISRRESRKRLGKQIAESNPEIEKLIWSLFEDFRKDMQLGVPFNPAIEAAKLRGTAPPWRLEQKLAIIESEFSHDIFEQKIEMGPATVAGVPGQPGQTAAVRAEVVGSGWNHYE